MAPKTAGLAKEVQELKEKNAKMQDSYNALLARLEAIKSNQRRIENNDADTKEEEEEEEEKNNEEEQEE